MSAAGPGRAALWALLLGLPALARPAEAPPAGRWDFGVTLDGKPIGTHRFVVSGEAGARRVESRARFVVRWLGVPVYRYRHEADERWQGDCLRELRAETETDGQTRPVALRLGDECPMSFAYWNPRLLAQSALIDPQTGQPTPVRFERLPDARIEQEGGAVPARGWRLRTAEQRIDIWYAADSGRWIALDADVEGGRRLSYRLTTPSKAP